MRTVYVVNSTGNTVAWAYSVRIWPTLHMHDQPGQCPPSPALQASCQFFSQQEQRLVAGYNSLAERIAHLEEKISKVGEWVQRASRGLASVMHLTYVLGYVLTQC